MKDPRIAQLCDPEEHALQPQAHALRRIQSPRRLVKFAPRQFETTGSDRAEGSKEYSPVQANAPPWVKDANQHRPVRARQAPKLEVFLWNEPTTESCHCGTIRFEADLDLHAGTFKCNCEIVHQDQKLGRDRAARGVSIALRRRGPCCIINPNTFITYSAVTAACAVCLGENPPPGGKFYAIRVTVSMTWTRKN